jgi:hypothetical protein
MIRAIKLRDMKPMELRCENYEALRAIPQASEIITRLCEERQTKRLIPETNSTLCGTNVPMNESEFRDENGFSTHRSEMRYMRSS